MVKMNPLDKQIKDWVEIRTLCRVANIRHGNFKKETLNDMYSKIKDYYHTYHEKFNFNNKPEGDNRSTG